MENYLVINGKRVDLTEEQLEKLGLKIEKKSPEVKKKSPFDRVGEHDEYYYISSDGKIDNDAEIRDFIDNAMFNVANYCTDKELMTARAKEEVLNRLLWRFSMENGGDKIDWTKNEAKYYVYKNNLDNEYETAYSVFNSTLGVVYFNCLQVAQEAIKKIIIPFYNGELEVCKIWEE